VASEKVIDLEEKGKEKKAIHKVMVTESVKDKVVEGEKEKQRKKGTDN
jgi:hypothetical protein